MTQAFQDKRGLHSVREGFEAYPQPSVQGFTARAQFNPGLTYAKGLRLTHNQGFVADP